MKKYLLSSVLILLAVTSFAQGEVAATNEKSTRRELYIKPDTKCIPFRIPAIATASNGDLVTVCDYRFSREDIGVVLNGRIDLVYRTSKIMARSGVKPICWPRDRVRIRPTL